jgi:hypothetical protein
MVTSPLLNIPPFVSDIQIISVFKPFIRPKIPYKEYIKKINE